jgi:hypothetical protein
VGVEVGVAAAVGVEVGDAVAVAVAVGVAVAVCVAVGVAVGGETVGVVGGGVGVNGVGVGVGGIVAWYTSMWSMPVGQPSRGVRNTDTPPNPTPATKRQPPA